MLELRKPTFISPFVELQSLKALQLFSLRFILIFGQSKSTTVLFLQFHYLVQLFLLLLRTALLPAPLLALLLLLLPGSLHPRRLLRHPLLPLPLSRSHFRCSIHCPHRLRMIGSFQQRPDHHLSFLFLFLQQFLLLTS